MYLSWTKLSENFKNVIGILVGSRDLELMFKRWQILLWSISQEPLDFLKSWYNFRVSQTIDFKMLALILPKKPW